MSTATIARPQQQNAIARVDERTVLPIPELRKLVGAKIDVIRDALPEKMKGAAPRFAIALASACEAAPKLAECTALSLFGGLVKAANLGLELGGECWLIPRKGRANFQIGYKGVVALLYRNPRVARVSADSVRKGDEFDLIGGSETRIVHKYGRIRGEVEAYYAVVKLTGGESVFKVMSVAEIDDHRKKFSEFGRGPNGERAGTWLNNFDAMALKTVVIQAAKLAPRSVELPESAVAEEVEIVPDHILPAAAEQPKPEGEISGNNRTAASLEDLDTLVAFLSTQEEREGSDIEYEACSEFGVQMFSQLNEAQRLEAFKALEKLAVQS